MFYEKIDNTYISNPVSTLGGDCQLAQNGPIWIFSTISCTISKFKKTIFYQQYLVRKRVQNIWSILDEEYPEVKNLFYYSQMISKNESNSVNKGLN